MAKAYIANRPVRFDKNYKVGEIIPENVIEPHMTKKLVEMGRILCVDIPDAINAQEGESSDDNIISPGEDENAPAAITGAPTGEKFVCGICKKEFKSQNALTAHLKSHKS